MRNGTIIVHNTTDGHDVYVGPSFVIESYGLPVLSGTRSPLGQSVAYRLQDLCRSFTFDVFAVVKGDDQIQIGVILESGVLWNRAGTECLDNRERLSERADDIVATRVRSFTVIATKIYALVERVK